MRRARRHQIEESGAEAFLADRAHTRTSHGSWGALTSVKEPVGSGPTPILGACIGVIHEIYLKSVSRIDI